MREQSKNIHRVVLAGLFIALSVLIPVVMPIKYTDGVFSATLAAHTPIVLSMFLGPWVAAAVAVGSALGFLTMGPIIAMRAAMHIPFAVVGALMLKKKQPIWLVFVVTAVLHAGFEMLIVWLLYEMAVGIDLQGKLLSTTIGIVGIGTVIHYLVDFLIAMLIYKPLEKSYFSGLR